MRSVLAKMVAAAVLLVAYLLMSGSCDLPEIVVGSAAALLALWLTMMLGPVFRQPLRFKAGWLRTLALIPWAMLQETWLLIPPLLQRLKGKEVDGTLLTQTYTKEQDALAPARSAWMTFGVCITPNSYLVDHDHYSGKLFIRQLVGPRLSRVDRRFVELP